MLVETSIELLELVAILASRVFITEELFSVWNSLSQAVVEATCLPSFKRLHFDF